MPRPLWPALLALAALATTVPLLGAGEAAPAQPPANQPPSQAEVLENMLRDKAPPPTAPLTIDAAGKTADARSLDLAELLHAPAASLGALEGEGSLVVQARAQLVIVGGDKKIPVLVFHSENAKEPRRPMVLLANRKLEELEMLREKFGKNTQFTVSGVVEVYRGNNYLQLKRVTPLRQDGNLE